MNNTEHPTGCDTKTSCTETLYRKWDTKSQIYVPKGPYNEVTYTEKNIKQIITNTGRNIFKLNKKVSRLKCFM